jgi:hypothetical protein
MMKTFFTRFAALGAGLCLVACSSTEIPIGDGPGAGSGGVAGSAGAAGSENAGSGQAGSAQAGQAQAGQAQAGNAGSAQAGSGNAGSGGSAQAGTGGAAGQGGAQAGSGGSAQAGSGGSGGSAAGSGGDAGAGGAGDVLRPLAPLSTATVTSQTPTLRWVLPAGADGAQVELFHDRACTQPIGAFHAAGDHGAPAAALAAGVVFWRVTATSGGVAVGGPSVVWQFNVGHGSAPVDTSWGTTLDLDGDGFADIAIGTPGTDKVLVYPGSASGIATSPSLTLTSAEQSLSFGNVVAGAGDINGDGFADLVVGAPQEDSNRGAVYVYLGGPAGIPATASIKLAGPDSNSYFGSAVASVGDTDNDGYADLLVGAPNAYLSVGAAYVFRGGPQGFAADPNLTIPGTPPGVAFGTTVASAGDFNGDGYGDMLIGAVYDTPEQPAAALYPGGAQGCAAGINYPLKGSSGSINGFMIDGVGDVDGDGYADVALGTQNSVLVYRGAATISTDVPSSTIASPADLYAFFAVAGAGDLDGDGFADLVVCARSSAPEDRVYVFPGSAQGPVQYPTVTLTNSDPTRTLETAVSAGDVNGDGFDDLAVSLMGAYTFTGRAETHHGKSDGISSSPSRVLTDNDPASLFGRSLAGSN